MSCTHCSSAVPSVPSRSRFCVGCGRRLPPTAGRVRAVPVPLRRPAEVPAAVGG
jgi:hypothetical protein